MTNNDGLESDAKRDATDSIRGYVYQFYQSVLAWIQLRENEILLLEGSEDFDLHADDSVTTTQVKSSNRNLTLRSPEAVDALNNYWKCCEKNPGDEIYFRFLTTSEAGLEQGAPFGANVKGLEYWAKVKAKEAEIDIEPLKCFLLSLSLDSNLTEFIQKSSNGEIHEKLITRINWDLGNRSIDGLKILIEDKLKYHGYKFDINSQDSCNALPFLLQEVADLLSTTGQKQLRFIDFLSCFDSATRVSVPRSKLVNPKSDSSNLEQIVKDLKFAEITRLRQELTIVGDPIPPVDGGIARENLVTSLKKKLTELQVIFLYGSSGTGKSNLASLISTNISGNWKWVSFRGIDPIHIKDILTRITFQINNSQLVPLLIIDDIDLKKVSIFEREIISLIFLINNIGGMVVFTSHTPPPVSFLPKIWKNELCEINVPYFEKEEVSELIEKNGLKENKRLATWAQAIFLTTMGHPQLVHARVRNVSAKNWPSIDISDITEPEDIKQIQSEARTKLINEFPSESARILAYRLSIINGAFKRETALSVAALPPSTPLFGEVFDSLVGPWVEKEGENRFTVSPLLKGVANDVLQKKEIGSVHVAVGRSIISNRSINQYEFGAAFFHAFMAKDEVVLTQLSHNIQMANHNDLAYMYDAISWFTLVCLEKNQSILPDVPGLDTLLRLAQYKLITESNKIDNALSVIDRIEESLIKIEPEDFKEFSEIFAYTFILNTLNVEIPSQNAVRMISRLIDLIEKNEKINNEFTESLNQTIEKIKNIGDNKPTQVLFTFQATRISGFEDLSNLFNSLESLPAEKRNHLLEIFKSEYDIATHLLNNAWLKELKDQTLDFDKAIKTYNVILNISRKWEVASLIKACLIILSIIHDEYEGSIENALKVIKTAEKEFSDDPYVLNQKAKVLFHAKRTQEALILMDKVLDYPNFGKIEFVFGCRNTGRSVAENGNWEEAEKYFLLGFKKAMQSDSQRIMGVGLIADAAFAQWKQNKYSSSLLLLADTLDLLGKIPLTDDIHTHHLHATVRHLIFWIHNESQGKQLQGTAEPYPGMCSNQEPSKGIIDKKIIDIGSAWIMISFTERILGLNIGINERHQAISDDKIPVILEEYNRFLSIDLVLVNRQFNELVPAIIKLVEALQNLQVRKDKDNDNEEWEFIEIPKLPIEYWENPDHWSFAYHYFLIASMLASTKSNFVSLPIDNWRSDLSSSTSMIAEANQFLDVLNGAQPNESIYQQAASELYSLRNETIHPTKLLKTSFRLLNALMDFKGNIENRALEELLLEYWVFAVHNQRFAFSTPTIACAEIEKCCLDESIRGFVKIAKIIHISAPYLIGQLPAESQLMLNKLINNQ